MKRLIISSLIILFLFQLSLPGRVTHDNELSPGDDEIKKTSVSPVISVAKSNFMVEPPGEPEPEPESEPPRAPKESIEGISIDEIIEWIKRNPWIVQLITESPDNKKLKDELVKYFNKHAAWEKEKQQKLHELTETGNTGKHLQAKMREIAQLKAQALEIDTDTIDGLKLLLNKKNAIILELESALQISDTLSQSNHLFYTNEFQLRYIANGILKDAGDSMEKTNLLVIGLGGYYDPWKKTYGAGIFVGIDIRSLLKKVF
jgi:hypothetical protein